MKTKNIFQYVFLTLLLAIFGNLKAQWQTSGTNIFYNTGNVGIGTNAPTARLTLRGDYNLRFEASAGAAPNFYITTNSKL